MRTAFLSIASLAAFACSSGSDRKLVILHTNDEHSHIQGYGPEKDDFPPGQTGTGQIVGGASRRATVFQQERARAQSQGAATVTVSAGDNMMGTLVQMGTTTAAPDYQVMRMLGYDVTALGNHEFDFGPAALAQSFTAAVAGGGMPVALATNIHFSGTAADKPLADLFDDTGNDAAKPLRRWTTVTKGGIKIGLLGVVGVDAAIKAPTKAPVTFSKASCCGEDVVPASMSQLFSDLQPWVDRLRGQEKVDLVVLLSHSGVDPAHLDQSEDHLIARNVSGIDVIVSGHSHTRFPAALVKNDKSGKNVLIQQAGAFGAIAGRIQLTVKSDGNVEFDTANSALIDINDTIPSGDKRIDDFMTGFVQQLETTKVVPPGNPQLSFLKYSILNSLSLNGPPPSISDQPAAGELYFRSFGKTTFDVPGHALHRESQLQILVTDAELWAAEQAGFAADAAVTAQGAIRANIDKGKTGDLSFADLYRVVPLGGSPKSNSPGYPLCRFALSLAEIKGAFDLVTANLAQQSEGNNDYFLMASGMKFTYDMTRPAFDAAGDPLSPANGRVTKIEVMDRANHPNGGYSYDGPYTTVYDASHTTNGRPDPFFGNNNALKPYVIITNLYVATLSYIGGVKLKQPAPPFAVLASPNDAIINRSTTAEIKDWEALAGYVQAQTGGTGNLPARYNPAVSTADRRVVCVGANCP
jgi:5'-nucleotidase